MRVTSSAYYDTLSNQLQTQLGRQTRLQNQVSSGQRITNPGDDPAAMGRVLNAQADQGLVQQYYQNAQRGLTINEAGSAGVSALKDLSDRAGEIAALTSGTTGSVGMKAYATEVNQLMEQALQGANGKLDGAYLFGGTRSDAAPFTAARDAAGNISTVSYQGAAGGAAIAVDGGAQVSPYTGGSDNANFATFINNLGKLRDALNSGDANAAQAVRTDLSTSEANLVNTVGTLGAMNSRLTAAAAASSSRFDNLQSQISNDTAADLPSTIIKLNQAQTAYQAALQTGAKVLSHSLLDYIG